MPSQLKAPKRKDDGIPVDPREAELVEEMTLDVYESIYVTNWDKIKKQLTESTNTKKDMSTIVYNAIVTSAENRKSTAQVEMDMDMMLGVATAGVDMVTEVAQAAGQVMQGSDVQTFKEDVLLGTVVMHGSMLERTPEQRQRAMTDLRDYLSDDGAQKAFDYVNMRAQKEGKNPQDMVREGNKMLFGSVNPVQDTLKASVKKGLMDQQAQGNMALQERNAQAEADNAPMQIPEGAFPERNSYGEILNPGPEAPPPAPAMPEQAPDAGLMAQGNMRQPPAGTPYYEDPAELAKIYPGGQ